MCNRRLFISPFLPQTFLTPPGQWGIDLPTFHNGPGGKEVVPWRTRLWLTVWAEPCTLLLEKVRVPEALISVP